MNTFLGELKEAAEAKKWKWTLRFCGDGGKTYKAFKNERNFDNGSKIIVLLVDSEEPVTSPTVVEHLRTRQENKLDLAGVPADHVHLMVQTMETWIVADRATLNDYYKPGFLANALPSRHNLEEENKTTVAKALDQATEGTQKGCYQKIRHASELLTLIKAEQVRRRCPHCERLFKFLRKAIEDR